MTFGGVTVVLLLAIGPNWAIVDIPYPEAGGGTEVRPLPVENQVADAVAAHAKARAVRLAKADIREIRVEGPKATARILLAGRVETLYLELLKGEWQVVKAE